MKKEESKDDDDNEDESSNNNADEYDPMEAEDADEYDDEGISCILVKRGVFFHVVQMYQLNLTVIIRR